MLSANASVLKPELLQSRPVQVIEQAIASDRLGHALLLHGDDLTVLEELAQYIAGQLLKVRADGNILHHPDLLTLGPSGKARQIRIGKDSEDPNSVRSLIHEVHLSPVQSTRKVALIREIDRMNNAAANALLKTLEEPPADTTLLLLTTRPYDLLATIRSRCLNFRIPTGHVMLEDGSWRQWLDRYGAWIERLLADKSFGKERPADAVLPVFGFTLQFSTILKRLDEQYWKDHKEALPDTLDADQVDALKAGHFKMTRHKMLCEIEQRTRDVALQSDKSGFGAVHLALAEAVNILEKCAGLLEVNLNADAALEHFLLSSLKIWTRAAFQTG